MTQVHFNREPLVRFMQKNQRNQKWLARAADTSEAVVSRLLNYSLPAPEIRTAEKLARVVGCKPLELYVEVEEKEAATN